MAGVDHFASTARGLFLRAGGLPRNSRDVPLLDAPVSPGEAAAFEVIEAPAGCRVGRLEIIEPISGASESWQTSEVDLREGMRLVGVIGGRLATRSISGRAPASPTPPGSVLDLLNTGGVVGLADRREAPLVKLKVAGPIDLGGGPALISGLGTIPSASREDDSVPGPPLVLITGSDMDVGKTTCAASLSISLKAAGIRVTYAKLTGTGRMRDLMKVCYGRPEGYFDDGRRGWDFVDAGLATTFEIASGQAREVARALLRHAASHGEIVLAEIADAPNAEGSLHVATDPWIKSWIQKRGLVVCACDSTASTLTVQWLRAQFDLGDEEILISGRLAGDPATRREVERMTGLPVVSCAAPSAQSPPGSGIAGGAMADWVIRHIMSRRKVAE